MNSKNTCKKAKASSYGPDILHATDCMSFLIFFSYVDAVVTCFIFKGLHSGQIFRVALGDNFRAKPRAPFLIVSKRSPNWLPKYNFTVCPGPWHQFSQACQFIQFYELSQIFGANYFLFYNFSVSPTLEPLLQHYYDSFANFEVLKWNVPVSNIHYFAQHALIMDCVYRAYLTSRYVAHFDLDEIILPLVGTKWLDFIPQSSLFGSYQVQASYVPLLLPDDNVLKDERVKRFPLSALLYTKRHYVVLPNFFKSKWIARPETIELPSTHKIRTYLRNKKTYFVPPEQALVLHYRTEQLTNITQMKSLRDAILEKLQKLLT